MYFHLPKLFLWWKFMHPYRYRCLKSKEVFSWGLHTCVKLWKAGFSAKTRPDIPVLYSQMQVWYRAQCKHLSDFCFNSLCSVGLISFSTPGPKLIQFREPVSAPAFASQCLRKACYFESKSCLHAWVFYITKSGWKKPVCRAQTMLSNKRLRKQRQELKRWGAWYSDSYLCNIHNIFLLG